MSSLIHQLLIREVNARIRELSDRHCLADGTYILLCECGEEGCLKHVEVPVAAYRGEKPEVGLEPTTSALQERCSAS